ncbi:hypothetical protein L3V77_09110 [Vibrio sp. DW001]|uniref:hypothetical protein n=1 Tax=Vibrio sp. DW001 TaxID=2912315 RepID=UPI0023AEFFDC|nr:hypothetical protein [Vibrio sp. DW001]WED25236.1 hypothetical protein L3V77_09110 [Vibrio sp. DW001]
MPAVLQMAYRFGIAAVLLMVLMLWRKERLFSHHTWKSGLIAGVLFAALILHLDWLQSV